LSSHLLIGLPSDLFPLAFIRVCHLPHTCYVPRPSHATWFDRPDNICWKYKLHSSSLCCFRHPVTLFLNTLNLFSSHNVSHQVSQSHKTTGKVVLCIF
jgi:hypothetical protein